MVEYTDKQGATNEKAVVDLITTVARMRDGDGFREPLAEYDCLSAIFTVDCRTLAMALTTAQADGVHAHEAGAQS